MPPQSSSGQLCAVLLRILTTMNSTYRNLSSYPPDQNSRNQEHQGPDVSILQTLDYEAPSPGNMPRRASAVSSRTLSTHGSNISSRGPSPSDASHTSTDRTASEPVDPPQVAARQKQSATPHVKEAKYSDDKRSAWSLLQK